MSDDAARVVRINGSLVEIEALDRVSVFDLVEVGDLALAAEVTAVHGTRATAEVHEYTGGLTSGARARSRGHPLSASLGPGLLGGVFDGLLRPLAAAEDLLHPGATRDHDARRFRFAPRVREGDSVAPGDLLGIVTEGGGFEHRVLVPPGRTGTVGWIATDDRFGVRDRVAIVGGADVSLAQQWPIRVARPFRARLVQAAPLQTGQRILDLLYPVARGSTAAVPGGFGTGKTMLLQQIAKWCDADVIIYVGCGERGNEMADVLEDLYRLEDPRSGRPLLERTVIIANTSNMPMMAREASVYTGMTVAEYFRDMGYEAVVIADSTSRWAEAIREFASRTGELPAEEGYPASLASSLAAFYERAGRVETLGGLIGSVTVIASTSPPGGDFTEPVTAHTQRFVRTFWTLDHDLAYARHYPAVSWHGSFSRDADLLGLWHTDHGDQRWAQSRARALTLLAEADRLESLVALVGANALPDRERVVLLGAGLIRDGVLQQSALSEHDAFCGPLKQAALLEATLDVYDTCLGLLDRGVSAAVIEECDLRALIRARDTVGFDDADAVRTIADAARRDLEDLR